MALTILCISFLLFLILGVPVAFAIGLSAVCTILYEGLPVAVVFQRMTAGTGIRHSEFNQSPEVPLHLLQIWIRPDTLGLSPGYEQREIPPEALQGRLFVVASPAGDGLVHIHQDARLLATQLTAGQSVSHPIASGRYGWVQVAHGNIELNGHGLAEGDGAAVSQESTLEMTAITPAEVLVFDLR